MKPTRVLLIVKVNVKWPLLEDFNEWWGKNSLPNWVAHGAKHIGSFENYLGAPKNQIIRICEFDDFSKFEKFMEWRNEGLYGADPSSKERAERIKQVTSRVDNLEESVWFSIY